MMYHSNVPSDLRIATHYFRTTQGIVVAGWNSRGCYVERHFIGYTLREIRYKLANEGCKGAWTFRRYA